jgi:hypothetical protein
LTGKGFDCQVVEMPASTRTAQPTGRGRKRRPNDEA